MIRASYSLARTPVRSRRLAISILSAAFVTTACGGQAATPSATSVATSLPSITATTAPASTAADLSPTDSPAPLPGGRLAYGRFSPDGTHVFTANTDGTDEQALLPSIAEGPRFSPDGRRIAVATEGPQGLLFLSMVNPDGSGYRRFPRSDPTLYLGCGAWSPDASRLACEGWDDSNPARNGIYTVRASDGGGLTRVTTSPGGGHDVVGDYSPDGRQIVFLRSNLVDEEHNTLMVVNADGSDPRVLTDRKVGLASRWSPDGKTILTEANGSLLLMPVDGSEPSAIKIDADAPVTATRGAWSPDGTWIVFSRVSSTGEDIYIMRNDGTNLHQVTNTPAKDEEFGEWGVPAP
jgi:dipeptidyl aminopeptidase/acylaminoacyl peptidase